MNDINNIRNELNIINEMFDDDDVDKKTSFLYALADDENSVAIDAIVFHFLDNESKDNVFYKDNLYRYHHMSKENMYIFKMEVSEFLLNNETNIMYIIDNFDATDIETYIIPIMELYNKYMIE